MQVRASVAFRAARERVWSVLVRWEDQPRWMVDAASVRTEGHRREGVGTRLAVRTRVLGLPLMTDHLEVTAWEPGRRIDVAHRGFVRGTGRWLLEDVAGGSRLTWTEDLRLPVPVVGSALLWWYRPFIRRLMQRSVDNLAAAIRPPASTP